MQDATEPEPIIVQVVTDAMKSPGLVVLVPMVRPVDCGYAADLDLTDNVKWVGPLESPK